jgi:hypothetical protein
MSAAVAAHAALKMIAALLAASCLSRSDGHAAIDGIDIPSAEG